MAITGAQIDAMLANAQTELASESAQLETLRTQAAPLLDRIAKRERRVSRITDTISALLALKTALAEPVQ